MNQNDNIDVRQLWNILARRKWAIASLAIGAGVLAALVVFAMTPTYKASATILIESTQANVVSIQEVYGLDTQNQQYYASQFEILKSRPIIEAVISSLGLADNPEFNSDEADTRFKIDWRSWLPKTFYDLSPKTEDEEVQRSVEVYLEKLSVDPVRKTQLVNVHFESEDPALAARIANTHAQAYIESMFDARVTATQSASGWMSTRIEGLQQKLLESERKLQEFREKESLVDVEGLKSLPAKEVNDLTARLADARRQLSVAKIAYLQVYGTVDAPADRMQDIPAILNDEVVQKFQQAKAVAQQKVAELEKRYGPQHPKMIAAQADLAKASENLAKQQGSVAASLQNDYEAAQSEVTALERALSRAKQQYQKIGRVESSLANLQREVDTNRVLYDLFYSRMKETAETGDMAAANARIISPAVLPYKPYKPRKKLVVGLAALAGLAIGVIAAFLLESLNNTIRSSTDVEEKLGLPLLGMLPILQNKKKKRVPGKEVFDKRESAFNEVIRTVRTGIALSNLDKPHKVILVTSSIGDEGKTTVATDLAFAFAKTERVLLIDCDLRRPSVGTNLGLARNMPGLTDLIGETSSPAESITYVEHGGFHVLQSGLIPPDPQSVLSSRRVSNLFGALHKFYDRIIVDSPPVNPVSDAVMLSVHADAVVFVVRSDSTSVHQIKGALHQLQRVNAPLTGVVVNQLNTRLAEKYSDYGYGGYGESYEPYQLEEPERAVG